MQHSGRDVHVPPPIGSARHEGAGADPWRGVMDAAPGFVLLLNDDHVCTYVSPGLERQLGIPAESMIGQPLEVLLAPDGIPEMWRARAALAAGEQRVVSRVRVVAADGGCRWFECSSSRVPDGDRHVLAGGPHAGVRTVVHARDVTAEVESQEMLGRAGDRYRQLLAAIDEAVLQLDRHGRVESFNRQLVALVRRTAEELLGARASVLLDLRDEDGRPVSGPLDEALAEAPAGASVWRSILRGDGQRRLVRITSAAFAGPRGDGGTVLVLREPGTSAGDGVPVRPNRQQARRAAGLTAREGDVLDGLADGADVPTIARRLGISVHSVRGHVKSITAKLGVHSQLQAVIAAAQRGMVDLSGA